MHPLIIIGAGLAGYTLAREFRKLDKDTPLVILTADDGGFYSKPMLSNAFAQKRLPAQLQTQSAEQMATQLGARVLTRTVVSAIDTAQRVVNAGDVQLPYSHLVLAVGAQPIRLAIAGDASQEIMSVNHLDDYATFRARVDGVQKDGAARIVILGAGLIGCEFADDLAGAGHAVTLIDPSSLPLAALAAPALSEGLRDALQGRGVTLRTGVTARAVDRAQDGLRLTLSDDATIDADIVLSAVGLRADVTLARAAGLTTQRAICVDAFGKTSDPHVFALGDCAEYSTAAGPAMLPYVAPLMSAARAIARTLHGEPTEIDLKPAAVLVKTPSYPLALMPPSAAHRDKGRWHVDVPDGATKRTVCRYCDVDGVLRGFGLSHHDASSRQALTLAVGTVVHPARDAA